MKRKWVIVVVVIVVLALALLAGMKTKCERCYGSNCTPVPCETN